MAYNYKIIDFLATKNVIEINNEEEYIKFQGILRDLGMEDILGKHFRFEDWQHLATINGKDSHHFYFEYDNSRGISWYDNKKDPLDWYGVEPLKVNELYQPEGDVIRWVHQ